MTSSLLKLQIGPVQEFIAQARTTRDLWSASYLLSFLMATAIREILPAEGKLIFPNADGQPLFRDPGEWDLIADHSKLLTPNVPNVLVARVPAASATHIADKLQRTIKDEWKNIAESCWNELIRISLLKSDQKAIFDDAVDRHLNVSWVVTPETGNYSEDTATNARYLDSIRQTRYFAAPLTLSMLSAEKDYLTGIHPSLARPNDDIRKRLPEPYRQLFKHDDQLGAITLIKRVWHLARLSRPPYGLRTSSRDFQIHSTRAIAARTNQLDEDDNTDSALEEKYLAAIAFDGDAIGQWVSGAFFPHNLEKHHRAFSAALSDFALNRARRIVDEHAGFLIYSGGDDVLALTPADAALRCARELRAAFREATSAIIGTKDGKSLSPDASAGIAIAHFKSPLQDLVREAQTAEKRAKQHPEKGGYGRSAAAITLMKRSGELIQWGYKWDVGASDLYQGIANAMVDEDLGTKFPHRLCELLKPYLAQQTALSCLDNSDGFRPLSIIESEFNFVVSRQGSKQLAANLLSTLRRYLCNFDGNDHAAVKAIIGLCETVAFTHRIRPQTAVSTQL